MVGIKITKKINDQNDLKEVVGSVLIYATYPKRFFVTENVIGGYDSRTDLHSKDGFKPIQYPAFDSSKQKLGEIKEETEFFTYEVIAKSDQEIQTELLSTAEITQQNAIDEKIKIQNTKAIVDAAQAETNVDIILESQAIYPLWDGNGKDYIPKIKCQWFNDKNEMVLWECIQPVTSQLQYPPLTIPAHFKRVAKDGEILVWKQPLGSEDAYKKGTIVWFPTLNSSKYESLIDANVYSPTEYPAGWKKL